jgi:hypothetical protein
MITARFRVSETWLRTPPRLVQADDFAVGGYPIVTSGFNFRQAQTRTRRAKAAKGNFQILHAEAMTLCRRQSYPTLGNHVLDRTAAVADEMLMTLDRIGIVALRPGIQRDLTDLAQRVKLVKRVVHGGAADLGQALDRSFKHLLGGKMHVFPLQHLRNHPALRCQTQAAVSQPLQKGSGTQRCYLMLPAHCDYASRAAGWSPILAESVFDSTRYLVRINLNHEHL